MKTYIDYLKNLFNFKDPIGERTYKQYNICLLTTLLIFGLIFTFIVWKLPDADFYTNNMSNKEIKRNLQINLKLDFLYISFIVIFYLSQVSMEVRRFIKRVKSPKLFISLMLLVIFIYVIVVIFDYSRGHLVRHNIYALFMWLPLMLTDSNSIFKRKEDNE